MQDREPGDSESRERTSRREILSAIITAGEGGGALVDQIAECPDVDAARALLQRELGISADAADAVLAMQLRQYVAESRRRFRDDVASLPPDA